MTTNRLSINSLTSDQLETLLRERQQARASLAGTAARLRQVSAERDQLRTELAEARADLAANDDELNEALLHNDETCSAVAERDRLARELAALRAATPDHGYCPECGRGDCSPGHAEWQQQYRRAERAETTRDQLHATLAEVLGAFRTVTNGLGDVWHQGQPIHPDDFARWRAALNATPEADRVPQPPGCDTGRHIHHPGLTCDEADAQIAAERAYRDSEWLARRLNGDTP